MLLISSVLTCARGPGSRGRNDVDVGVEILLAPLQLSSAVLACARLHVVACVHADAADAARPLFVFVRQVVGEGREGRWKGERGGDAVEWSVLSKGEAIFGRG